MKPRTKNTLEFLVLVTLCYTALAVPWPGLRQAYAAYYRGFANLLFHSFGEYGTVQFKPRLPHDELDTVAVLRGSRGRAELGLSSRHKGYLPTIALISLVLATPIALRRRALALAVALVAAHAFVALRTGLVIWNGFLPERAAGAGVVKALTFALVETPASYYVIPLLLWVLICFRREDWQVRRRGGAGDAGGKGP